MGFVALFLASASAVAGADADDDAMRVYCLAPEQRAAMSEAAVALGFAREKDGRYRLSSGASLELDTWREHDPADFGRTCSALMAARGLPAQVTTQQPAEPGVMATLLPFLTGLSGAVLAFVAAAWRDRVGRSRALADDLRVRFEEFGSAAATYLGSWTPSRSGEQVADRRGALLTQLARVRTPRRQRIRARSIEDELTTGPLGEDLTRNWAGQDHERTARLTERLGELRDSLFDIAHDVEHPLRAWWMARGWTDART
jgi:hypothetical protein